MQHPFCKICGEYHRLGHCPLYDEPPRPAVAVSRPAVAVSNPVKKHETAQDLAPDRAPEETRPGPAPKDPWREIYDQARSLAPEDMKQETMPEIRPRFDRNTYQRNLMRERRWKAING